MSQLFRRIGGRAERNENANHEVNENRPEVIAEREQVDLEWLMKPWSEPLPIPYIATVWDLEHRKQPYFPEVSASGWNWSERENVSDALLPRASMIITGMQAGKDEVVHYYRFNPSNVTVILLPVPAAASMAQHRKARKSKKMRGRRRFPALSGIILAAQESREPSASIATPAR